MRQSAYMQENCKNVPIADCMHVIRLYSMMCEGTVLTRLILHKSPATLFQISFLNLSVSTSLGHKHLSNVGVFTVWQLKRLEWKIGIQGSATLSASWSSLASTSTRQFPTYWHTISKRLQHTEERVLLECSRTHALGGTLCDRKLQSSVIHVHSWIVTAQYAPFPSWRTIKNQIDQNVWSTQVASCYLCNLASLERKRKADHWIQKAHCRHIKSSKFPPWLSQLATLLVVSIFMIFACRHA